MWKDNGKNPMPNDKGKGLMFTAFPNLSLHSNNNNFEQGQSSNNNNNERRGSSNNNNNLNLSIQYNLGHVSLEGPRFSAASLRNPPFAPSWTTQPGVSSSANSGQPSASFPRSFLRSNIDLDYDFLCLSLLDMMSCPTRHSEYQSYLEKINTYETAYKEEVLCIIGSIVTTNNSTFLDLATNQNGSQALRNLLKRSRSLDGLICEAVCINFRSLMNSKFGRYLIVPTIRAVDKPMKVKLYKHTYANALFLATQETGCVALNDVFQEIKGTFRDMIFDLVARNADWLSFDPYGTHVVQNFLTLQNPRATGPIAETLFGNFFKLAMGRQGSYVVEKCLKSEYGREIVLEEFESNDKEWVRMATDKFGNFVAQCALRVMKQRGMTDMLREFVEKLRPHFGDMKNGHGKNTLRVIQEEIEECLLELPVGLLDFLP